MPNHFHFLAKITQEDVEALNKAFRLFFMSYTKAINKQENRTGSLFQKAFKKKEIVNSEYYSAIIAYIHFNPVKAGLCSSPENWKFSSYDTILSEKNSLINREEVLDWFNGKIGFIDFHNNYSEFQKERAEALLFFK